MIFKYCKRPSFASSSTHSLFIFAVSFGLLAGLVGPATAFAQPVQKLQFGFGRQVVLPGNGVKTRSVSSTTSAKDLLAKQGVQPNRESLVNYFNLLRPTPENVQRVKQYIVDLGDDDFFTREAATRALLATPLHSPDVLAQAADSDDPEVRWRARQILRLADTRTTKLMFAALSIVDEESIQGVAPSILNALPLCDDEYLRRKAEEALVTSATERDVPLLIDAALGQHAVIGDNVQGRRTAVTVLEAIEGENADKTLLDLIESDEALLRLTAARALLNHGNRQGLAPLVDLLADGDNKIRVDAFRTLKASTGQSLKYIAYVPAQERQASVENWRRWLKTDGQTAELQFPLGEVDILHGRTLLANYTRKEVVELDADKKVVWRTPLNGAWACQGLPNGHRLVASYSDKTVAEFDAAGKQLWSHTLPDKPYCVDRLENGNTLVSCYNSELVEMQPDGNIVWRLKLPDRAKGAIMLETGLILVVYYSKNRIAEIDREGKERWALENVQRPYGVQRLPNGNTLVAVRTGNKVIELNRAGEQVWTYTHTGSLYAAQRLPDGNTLVIGSSAVVEVDRAGKKLWSYNQTGVRGGHRY